MEVNYIAWAIPAFVLLIGIEVLMASWQRKNYYRFNDAITDISCGIGQQVVTVSFKAALIAGYAYFYDRFALFDFSHRPVLAWTVAFFGVDFCYYWWHRASHRVNFMWAIHVIHHQSEEYNLAVALRQAWFSTITSLFFYLPLAFIGIPPLMAVAMISFNTLYQFWIHTRLIGKLGPAELVMNTPSHHRVHHGRNPKYLDKNYGATLISWDKLFGTFQVEEEEPVYGTIKPYASWNPIWTNFDYWVEIAKVAQRAPYFWDKIKIWFMYPGWQPRGLEPYAPPPEIEPGTEIRYDTQSPRGLLQYVAGHYITVAVALTLFLLKSPTISPVEQIVAGGLILLTTFIWGGLFERKTWALPLELGRLVALGVVAVVYMPLFPAAVAVWMILIGFAMWILRYRTFFLPGSRQAVPA